MPDGSLHMRYVLLIVVVTSFAALPPFASAQPAARLATGSLMPPLEGDLLSGREAVLPDSTRGNVALGFSYESRVAVEEWSSRFRQAFSRRDDVTLFEVPTVTCAGSMPGGSTRPGSKSCGRSPTSSPATERPLCRG